MPNSEKEDEMSKPQSLGEAGDRCPCCGGELKMRGPVGRDIFDGGEEEQYEEECIICHTSRIICSLHELGKPDMILFGAFDSERKA